MKPYFCAIVPFSTDPDYHRKRKILEEVARASDLEVHFPLDTPSTQVEPIISKLCGAEFVFVDLSYERPSCYYELGMAQAVSQRTYLLAEEATPIHQAEGDVHYYKTLDDYKNLVEEMIRILRVNEK